MPNVDLTPQRNQTAFRRMALGTWKTAKDPSVYGNLCLEVDEVLEYIDAYRAQTGRRLTLTHLMAKAVGTVLREIPDANAMLRFGRIYLRRDADVFFQVMMKDPETGKFDLSGLTIRKADTKSVDEIEAEFRRLADRVRAGKDKEKERTRRSFRFLPGFLVGPVLNFVSFLLYTLNLNLRWLGLPKDPYGSVMVTNIGSLGLEEAYAPLVASSRVPLLLAMGGIKKEPVVDDATDEIRIARRMRVFATFDHRLLDGAHAAAMATVLRRMFDDPWTHFGPIPDGDEKVEATGQAGQAGQAGQVLDGPKEVQGNG